METRQTTWRGYANENNNDGAEFYPAATNPYLTTTFVDVDAAIQLLTSKD